MTVSAVAPVRSHSRPSDRSPFLQRKCACGGTPGPTGECEECRKKRLQRKIGNAEVGFQNESIPPAVHDVLNTPGHALDVDTRTFMEPRFGHDFSKVRVHADTKSAESARSVSAQAYTVGRDIVFGSGHYAPRTNVGSRLIAHELAHVVQQSRSSPSLQPQSITPPDDALEREADAAATQVTSGQPATVSGIPPGLPLQRNVLNHSQQNFQSTPQQAKACVVHMHGEEKSALAVAEEIRSRRCVNLVHLDTDERYVKLNVKAGGQTHICKADPNRVFSNKGRTKNALQDEGCHLATNPKVRTDQPIPVKMSTPPTPEEKKAVEAAKKAADDVVAAAAAELKTFAENDWGSAIGKCRGGTGSPMLAGPLPVLALHNNGGGDDFTPAKFKSVAEQNEPQGTLPKGVANPSMKSGQNKHDFFLVTQAADFDELRKTRNVILQANPVPAAGQDGSLSVALANERFINVEKEGRGTGTPDQLTQKSVDGQNWKVHAQSYIDQYGTATQALDLFNVPEGPCLPPAAPATSAPSGKTAAPGSGSGANPTTPAQSKEDAPVLEREPVDPKKPPTGCKMAFSGQADLDSRKDAWATKIARIPLLEIVNWILGGPDSVSSEAREEILAQRDCMITAMRSSLTGRKLSLPAGSIIKSDVRAYPGQEKIWLQKFNFTFATKFGRISDTAKTKCGKLIGSETEWDPKSTDHQTCWQRKLDEEEKAKEILMTSSAPGISRHHAGSDFDFGKTDKDLEPAAWTGAGAFADAYRWLAKNASSFGFIQPFDTKGAYGQGYTAERWHWSYYPVAQALLEFSRIHRSDLQQVLKEHWSDSSGAIKAEFKFIWANWEKYMFNVEQQGRF
jgi:Domain of unknown function (DUF4157)/D-alanyl-D-alanine carboxypeptidase